MPPSRITGAKLDHIAFGLPSLADAPDTLVGLLGGRPLEGGPNPDFIGCQWEFARGARIECIAPNDSPTSFMKRFVETRGSGVHHMTFKVPDIYAARDEAEALGYIVTGFSDRYEAWKELFLHPKSAHGIVIQMAQTNPDLPDDSWSPDFDFPPYEGSNQVPSEPADLLGLRLVVERPEHAERLFGELLGGGATIDGQRTIYRWHESPLWVAVVVDSETEEGPQAIEVRAASCSRLSEEGIAAMGGRFEPA